MHEFVFDGTKLKANASKHKAMSYGRMPEREAALAAKVAAILVEADATDAAEDAEFGGAGATSCRRAAHARGKAGQDPRGKAPSRVKRRPAPATPMPSRIRGPSATSPIPRAA